MKKKIGYVLTFQSVLSRELTNGHAVFPQTRQELVGFVFKS